MKEKTGRIWQPEVTLESLQNQSDDTLVSHLGIELLELCDDYLSATMMVDARTCQPMRILHGGASVALAETLGSLGANSVIDKLRFAAVGQEINANHLRPVPSGRKVTGTARPVYIGVRSQVWSIEIKDDRDRLVCISRITMAVINR